MAEKWKFNLVGAGTESQFGGYISEVDRTTISRRYMVKGSKNVYLKRSGAIANRPGLLRRGSADATEAGVLASFEWDTSLGYTRPLRVADGKLQVESDILESGTYVWYDLLSSLTNTRLIFDLWWDNTAKKDILLFCDGTDNMRYWSGAIGLLNAATTTATIIGLTADAATLGFQSGGGTVIINGTEYTYGGISGSTLTGAQDATSEADGSVVLDKPVTDTDTVEDGFTIDFIRVVNNQLYAGSETSRLVYISKNTDWADFTQSSPRATGEGDTLTLDEVPYGIGIRDGLAHIGTRRAWYEISFDQITVGSNLSEQTKVKKVPIAVKDGLLRHEFIDNAGDDMLYVTQDQQLHIYDVFRDVERPRFPSLSLDIETELRQEDFTGGHLRVVGDFIYITAPNNGRVWLHETVTRVTDDGYVQRDRRWHAPFISNLSRIAVIGGTVYGHSNANPQIYQMWNTLQWSDDSPSDEQIPYDSVLVFGYRNAQDRHHYISFDKTYIEGYMAPGSDVRGAYAYEYKGERGASGFLINAEDTSPEFYIGDIGIALGETSLGDNPLGAPVSEEDADQELLPKFRHIADSDIIHAHEYQPRFFSTTAGSRWELLCFGENEEVSEEEPASLRE